MRLLKVLLVCLLVAFTEGLEENGVEARGKKKKIALFIYLLDLVVKKIFVVKIIYAFVFWLLLHKAGYFFGWFVSYLREQKHEYHHPHPHYDDYGPHGHYRRQNQKPLSVYNPYSEPARTRNSYQGS